MLKKIEHYLSFFEYKKRNDDDIVVLTTSAPQNLKDSVMKACGNRLSDDWIFDKYHSILDALMQCDINGPDDLDNTRSEIVDGLVDPYTSNLTAWLNSGNYNVYYITEAQKEFGPETDGFKILQMAQYKAIDDIYGHIVNLLQEGGE